MSRSTVGGNNLVGDADPMSIWELSAVSGFAGTDTSDRYPKTYYPAIWRMKEDGFHSEQLQGSRSEGSERTLVAKAIARLGEDG